MLALGLALVVAFLGSVPLMLRRRVTPTFILFGASVPILWLFFYVGMPSLVWPLWGAAGACVGAVWFVAAAIDAQTGDAEPTWVLAFPVFAVVLFIGRGCAGGGLFRSESYAKLVGEVEKREWTQDVQPKDPSHVRLVPAELALWLADKQLGEAPGAIGSQFQVSPEHLTLQMIGGELWYVAPLDYKGFSVWTGATGAPGYVMVHAEDPLHPVTVKFDEHFIYTPGAFFGDNLERHLWANGYLTKGLTDYSFEIDETGKAWWVVTVFEPTIGFWGRKATGAAVVDPTTGNTKFYPLGQTPDWIDRLIPGDFVSEWFTENGQYASGWWNCFWTHHNLTEPEGPDIAYGANGECLWVTGITSNNEKDESLVGLMYTNSHTGKSLFYHAVGGTDAAVLTAVNNAVSYKRWHGASPVVYNIYGTMASVVPLLGESHTYQGVAIVNVNTLQVALGADQYVALREYQKMLALSGQQVPFELEHDRKTLRGVIQRIAQEVKGTDTMYYLLLADMPHLFTGASELSPKLPLTAVGDEVELGYVGSPEDVMPLISFDNLSLSLASAKAQTELRKRVLGRKDAVEEKKEGKTAAEEAKGLSSDELRRALELLKAEQNKPNN